MGLSCFNGRLYQTTRKQNGLPVWTKLFQSFKKRLDVSLEHGVLIFFLKTPVGSKGTSELF